MTSRAENKTAIQNSDSNGLGKNLAQYLKCEAWAIDQDGETRVYLVKDEKDQIALFFSIKCGLLYEPYEYEKLEPTEQEFVNMILDALEQQNQALIQEYIDSGYYESQRAEELYRIALQRYEIKCEGRTLKDENIAFKVSRCYSAIELCHFCKNENYVKPEGIVTPIGFGLFWEVIVPKIVSISKEVGCKYLYLFAADQTEILGEEVLSKKLVDYYKNDLKFEDVQNMIIIKPQYDEFCYGMVQEIGSLTTNREAVWEAFTEN